MGNLSYSAIKTIIFLDIKNFFREFQFNIIGPLVSSLIFVLILSLFDIYFLESKSNYVSFLIPGITIMLVMQSGFNHLSEVIISMKQIGSFNDYLSSPVSRIEIYLSFLLSSIFVCLIVGITNLLFMYFIEDFYIYNFFRFIYYLIIISIISSSLGALTGFLSNSWDTQSFISTFLIAPVSFLSGTFFSINSINVKWHFVMHYNPFYFITHNFRTSFTYQDNALYHNDLFIFLFTSIIVIFSLIIYQRGYRVIY